MNFNLKHLTEIEDNDQDNQGLEAISCKIEHCKSCQIKTIIEGGINKTTYKCKKCLENYKLKNGRCYSKQCSAFGECKLCTEFFCYKCNSNYNLSHGICEAGQFLINLEICIAVLVPLFFVILLTFIIIISKKKRKELLMKKTFSAKMINKKRVLSGQYIITNNVNNNLNITNETLCGLTSSTISEKNNSMEVKDSKCVLCKDTNIYSFAECGCCLCKTHSKAIKNHQKLTCPIHGINLVDNLTIKKSKTKKMVVKTASDFLAEGIEMCEFCNIYPGSRDYSQSFNMLICEKCYIKLFSN